MTNVKQLLAEIEAELPTVEWTEVNPPDLPEGARFYQGLSKSGWNILTSEFSIEDQGFPPGSVGYDGTAVKDATVVRLTRQLAEKAFHEAEAVPEVR